MGYKSDNKNRNLAWLIYCNVTVTVRKHLSKHDTGMHECRKQKNLILLCGQNWQNWHHVGTSFPFGYFFNLFATPIIIICPYYVCCHLCCSKQCRTQITLQGWFRFLCLSYAYFRFRLILHGLYEWSSHKWVLR